jgi:hypothetical protein
MKAPGKVQLTVYLLGLAGGALFTGLLIHQGASQVAVVFATAKWNVLAVVAYHLAVPVFFDAVAWWMLFPKSDRLPLGRIYWMRWIGESVSTLVPSAAVGGDIVRARLASVSGVALPIAVGTVLVDVTLGVFTQAGFTLLGLVLLVDVSGQKNFVGPTLLGTLVGVLAVAGFYFVQRLGMFRFLGIIIARLANSPEWQSLVQSGEILDRTIRALYARWRGGRVVLRRHNCLAGRRLRRNLDRAPCSQFERDIYVRAHTAKYGFDDSLGCLCRPQRSWRAGRRLSCRRQSPWYSRRSGFCPIFDRQNARAGSGCPRPRRVAID